MAYVVFDTKLGPCALAYSDAGVTWVALPEETRAATVARLRAKANEAGAEAGAPPVGDREARPPVGDREARPPAWVREAVARLRKHLAGEPQDLSRIPIDLGRVSEASAKIYRALQRVPAGQTTTYGDLAKAIGSPGAARAVGRAMGNNPFPLLVPCHRVLSANGEGGFSAYGGLVTKEKILAAEGLALRRQASLFDGARPLPFDAERAVVHLSRADAPLAKHIAKVGPLRLRLEGSESTFSALAESIVYQQLSGKAAATIFSRVRALYPKGKLDPRRVLATPERDLRGAGLSASKHASLKDLADRSARGEIPTLAELERMDDETIVERLTPVRGVGRWTVEMFLIFRLGRPDVLPVADLGIKKGFARVFAGSRPRARRAADALPSADELVRRGERWRPFRSAASWYLWRAAEA